MAAYSSKAAERFCINEYEDYTGDQSGNVCIVDNRVSVMHAHVLRANNFSVWAKKFIFNVASQVSYTDEFASNLNKYLEQLLSHLDSNKHQALKCGEKIYAGLGGMALLSLLNDSRKDSLSCVTRSRTIRVFLYRFPR